MSRFLYPVSCLGCASGSGRDVVGWAHDPRKSGAWIRPVSADGFWRRSCSDNAIVAEEYPRMANVVVVGAQWGDEGKGKIVDWLSEQADIVVRFQGGHNAG